MTSLRTSYCVAVLAALVAGTIAGCDVTAGATKAGGAATPVTLRLGTDDESSGPTGRVIKAFAEQVREMSGATIRIEPVFSAGKSGGDTKDWDQRVARMVVAGKLEMGLIPSRAWDTEGVTSLKALSAPLLLSSQALVDEVVRSDVAGDMLAGLQPAGITGLALVPEGLRHVFSHGSPLVSPKTFAGTTIRTPRSETGYAMFRAWGATPDDLVEDALNEAASSGSLSGVDSSFARAQGLPGPPTTVAANLTTSANVQTLVVQSPVIKGLTRGQADMLRKAAIAARDAVLADPPDEAALARAHCANGGRVVAADAADLTALEVAARPVYAELERDPTTKAGLARIAQMKTKVAPAASIAPCEPETGTPQPSTRAAGTADTSGTFPVGVYRMEVSEKTLVREGMTQADAGNHAGIWTLTFEGGRLVVSDRRSRDSKESTGEGTYCVTADRVSLAPGQRGGCDDPLLFSARWEIKGRVLHFTDIDVETLGHSTPFADALWGSQAWTRID